MGLLVDSVSKRDLRFPESLRAVMMSGDWIPLPLPDQIRALMHGGQVYSLGGATEASIWSIVYPIGALDPAWSSIPYGFPMKNQSIHVLDHQLDPKPEGVVGELYIGGVGLALGYWNNPEQTQNSFIRHPATGERLYRTGDLGRFHAAGLVEFLGRRDSQIKIRGYRVELGEIEAQLAQHPLVDRAVVVTVGEARSIRALAAYVTLQREAAPRPEAGDAAALGATLKKWLDGRLPEYMVPAHFVLLEQLPLTANGKVNKGALPGIEERPAENAAGAAPETPLQEVLAQLCRDVANLARLGIHDNFFSMGYDSIQVIKLIERIRESLEVDFTMREVLGHPTVAQLERLIVADEDRRSMAQPLAELFLKIENMSEEELEAYCQAH
jgi:acyl-coenzyme A synthetase/AMP-(fatty) acid ligase/aryl carrier-like protein